VIDYLRDQKVLPEAKSFRFEKRQSINQSHTHTQGRNIRHHDGTNTRCTITRQFARELTISFGGATTSSQLAPYQHAKQAKKKNMSNE
jgi:hypothetical protein